MMMMMLMINMMATTTLCVSDNAYIGHLELQMLPDPWFRKIWQSVTDGWTDRQADTRASRNVRTRLNQADRQKSRAPSNQRRTNGSTNKAAYRVACTRLKLIYFSMTCATKCQWKHISLLLSPFWSNTWPPSLASDNGICNKSQKFRQKILFLHYSTASPHWNSYQAKAKGCKRVILPLIIEMMRWNR